MATATLHKSASAHRRSANARKSAKPLRDDRIPPPRSFEPSLAAKGITRVVLIVMALYFLIPVFWMIVSSTKTDAQLATTFGFWFGPDNHVAGNWDTLMEWSKGNFPRWVGNSLFYSAVSAVVGTLFSVMAGYAVAKYNFPGKKIAMGVIMAGLLLPVALLTIPLYSLFHSIGLTNTIWSIIIPSMVSPFGVFLGTVYAQNSVPGELLEAARIDGAGEARIFFTMVLRLLAPAMVTILLFIFVQTWNNFLLPLMMLSQEDLKPVTLGLYSIMNTRGIAIRPSIILGSLLGVIPLIIMFLGLQKYWRAGLAAGSVKG